MKAHAKKIETIEKLAADSEIAGTEDFQALGNTTDTIADLKLFTTKFATVDKALKSANSRTIKDAWSNHGRHFSTPWNLFTPWPNF